ncbi:ATP-dependent Zn protease [Pleurocapsa sp. CCALA 161]|uniref:ATP-dependent Zn protease n=1 Tax=Pleurocapsa sp. CCALA 161 TaxID=2107688 RepID=UPI000D06FB3A|nr:ATP-dependent Zn protease [Pleurocapsa sp. CCALA 161]PSB12684.1 ATP-dependent Zn protease [Pleurocapsa sp. CCALA 161]
MPQTALNLIAIGIFLMTMISLLGPIFHISPVVPAALTFGILSLATADTLSWNSRGVSLLLDLFASAEQRQRIINHEAGHFLTAYFLGIPITGYTLTAWEVLKQGKLGRGGVGFDTKSLTAQPFELEKMRLSLERFCTVWMAGIAAEKMVYGDSQGGAEDRQQLQQALMMAGLPEIGYPQKERWAQLQATNLLTRHQQSYEALVAAMTARASVEECYAVIQQHCDADSEQLAMSNEQ